MNRLSFIDALGRRRCPRGAAEANRMPETGYFLARCRDELTRLLAAQGLNVNPSEIRDVEGGIDADLAVPLFRIAKGTE